MTIDDFISRSSATRLRVCFSHDDSRKWKLLEELKSRGYYPTSYLLQQFKRTKGEGSIYIPVTPNIFYSSITNDAIIIDEIEFDVPENNFEELI